MPITDDSIYHDQGYSNRTEYLQSLAEDYGVDFDTVKMLAELLGENEDFDGLVIAVEDASTENLRLLWTQRIATNPTRKIK